MYLLGFDIGSSSVKAALYDVHNGVQKGIVKHPETEMDIIARTAGWAEQVPQVWWSSLCQASQKLLASSGVSPEDIRSIGLSYQMHGLVLIDQALEVLRPSIIWCDSRAVEIGQQAYEEIGEKRCLDHLLNSPGNFTASKLKWVREYEPEVYERIFKMLLPGDYIALKMTGEVSTTIPGLSEATLWDFQKNSPAAFLLDHFGIDRAVLPEVVPTFHVHGHLTKQAASDMGLRPGTPLTYRAGDQPNNAMTLQVLQPGDMAATGGTSGVVYGIVDRITCDPRSRVNNFAHVNHTPGHRRIGILLCINGAGIQYSWMRHHIAGKDSTYEGMEGMIEKVLPGSDGVIVFPFGNGAERMLGNIEPGSQIRNLNLNRHGQAHVIRAGLEGVAFSFVYGMGFMDELGLKMDRIRTGNDNLFRSPVFGQTIANLTGCEIQICQLTGALGAAKASGIATGVYASPDEAMRGVKVVRTYGPEGEVAPYEDAYQAWTIQLEQMIKQFNHGL